MAVAEQSNRLNGGMVIRHFNDCLIVTYWSLLAMLEIEFVLHVIWVTKVA